MRLSSTKSIASACLVAAVVLVLVASMTGIRSAFVLAAVLVAIGAFVGMYSTDQNLPTVDDTNRYVTFLLTTRGYGSSFKIADLKHKVGSGGEAGRATVQYRGLVQFTEPLYLPTIPPSEACNDFTPRRLNAITRAAARLQVELGNRVETTLGPPPTDPFQRVFLSSRTTAGWQSEVSGKAWAAWSEGAWSYTARDLPRELDALNQAGKPLGAFPDGLVLGSKECRQWLEESVRAWLDYEARLGELQREAEAARNERGRQAVRAFFATVTPGAFFGGTGETLTQQNPPTPYFIEVTSTDPRGATIGFLLRNDRNWDHARRFNGTASFDTLDFGVRIAARSAAREAVPDGGPVLNAATTCEIELRWSSGSPDRLSGSGPDLVLKLHEMSATQALALQKRVPSRKRLVQAAMAPASAYAGTLGEPGNTRRVLLTFAAAAEGAGVTARVESDSWSALFSVASNAAPGGDQGWDLVLEPLDAAVAVASTTPAASGDWHRILLRVSERALSGRIETDGDPLPINLQH